MRFIVDECTGVAVVEYLRSTGHDVLAVAEAMPQAHDRDILSRAMSEGRILVTKDKDFGELVFGRGQAHPGVARKRKPYQTLVHELLEAAVTSAAEEPIARAL